MRKQRMSRRRSRKAFRRGANREHPKNRWDSYFMRGGIRL